MSPLIREDRYIVIKRKDLEHLPVDARNWLLTELDTLNLPPRKYVVVESGWPGYEAVWAMLEARVAGTTNPWAGAGYNAGVHAAMRLLGQKAFNYSAEFGSYDQETGSIEFRNPKYEEYFNYLHELSEELKTLLITKL